MGGINVDGAGDTTNEFVSMDLVKGIVQDNAEKDKRPTRAITKLLAMPAKRHCNIRGGREIKFERGINVEAVLIQIVGATAVNGDCDHCNRGIGPFPGCYTVPGVGHGACGACHYNSEGTRCSFYQGTKKRGRGRNVEEDPVSTEEDPLAGVQDVESDTPPASKKRGQKLTAPKPATKPQKRQKHRTPKNTTRKGVLEDSSYVKDDAGADDVQQDFTDPYMDRVNPSGRYSLATRSYGFNPASGARDTPEPMAGSMYGRPTYTSPGFSQQYAAGFSHATAPATAGSVFNTPVYTAAGGHHTAAGGHYTAIGGPPGAGMVGGGNITIAIPAMSAAEGRRVMRVVRNFVSGLEAVLDPIDQ